MRRLLTALLLAATAVAPLRADLKYVTRLTAHPSTVPLPPSTNPMFAMFGGVIVGTLVPNGGLQVTVTIGDRGTRVECDQAYLLIPAGSAMLIKPDGTRIDTSYPPAGPVLHGKAEVLPLKPLCSDLELFDTHLSKPLRIEELSTLLERTTAVAR